MKEDRERGAVAENRHIQHGMADGGLVGSNFIGGPEELNADRASGLPRGDVEALPLRHLAGLLDGS